MALNKRIKMFLVIFMCSLVLFPRFGVVFFFYEKRMRLNVLILQTGVPFEYKSARKSPQIYVYIFINIYSILLLSAFCSVPCSLFSLCSCHHFHIVSFSLCVCLLFVSFHFTLYAKFIIYALVIFVSMLVSFPRFTC